MLVAQTANGTTTPYTQDLAAPLPQILANGSATYVYGMDRLVMQQGSTDTWYLGDALGSVRATVDAAEAVVTTASFDPWGAPETAAPSPFGFTGELQQGAMVYLRARWYNVGSGTFTASYLGWAIWISSPVHIPIQISPSIVVRRVIATPTATAHYVGSYPSASNGNAQAGHLD